MGGFTTGFYEYGKSTGIVTIASGAVSNAVAIAAGEFHNLALKVDGTVVGWGDNQEGRATGLDAPYIGGLVMIGGHVLSNVVSIAAGSSFSLGLKRDGTVVSWGSNSVPAGLSNVVAIAARGFFSLALKSDSTVVSWGSTPWDEAHVPVGLSNVVAIACGGGMHERSMAIKNDGTVAYWGVENVLVDLAPPAGLSNVVAFAASDNHSLALKTDGTVVGWGFNGAGQATGDPPEGDGVASHTVRISGQVLSNVVAIAAGHEYSLALKRDGTVVAWGNKWFYRDVPASLSNVVAIAAGDERGIVWRSRRMQRHSRPAGDGAGRNAKRSFSVSPFND